MDEILCFGQILDGKWKYDGTMYQLYIDFGTPVIGLGGRFCIM
jgi:hypothetical protein